MKVTKPHIVELAKTLSGHWYHVWKGIPTGVVTLSGPHDGEKFLNPEYELKKGKYLGVFPSSTTILNAYPQSPHLTKWIADNGWNESQRIKGEAGERGTRIHKACDLLEEGVELYESDYSLEEWVKICSFVTWHNTYKPVLIATEFPVFSPKGKYAGRLDRIYDINGLITLLDLKSSSGISDHFPLQFASYGHAVEETTDLRIDQTACLLLGASNKDGYRYVLYSEWQEHYDVFEHVRAVWQYDYFDSKKNPKEAPVIEVPDRLKLEGAKDA